MSDKTYYRDIYLQKEGKPMREGMYTISYKRYMDDEWVLVTKTGRSDSKEAKDIMIDLIKDEIPEDHLEVVMSSFEVNNQLVELMKEWKGGKSIE